LLGGNYNNNSRSGNSKRKQSASVSRNAYVCLLDQDEADKKRMISSKMSLSDNSNVSDDEDYFEGEQWEEEDGDQLEYDMWEGQFHLVSAPPPPTSSGDSHTSDHVEDGLDSSHTESTDSCWTSRSKPMQLRQNGSGGTFNRAASTLMPKNFFLTKSGDLFDEEEDLFGSPGSRLRQPGPAHVARQMSMPANIRHHSPTTTASIPSKTSTTNRDFNTLYWNGGRNSPFEDVDSGVQQLQEQVGHLAESQATTDDRYSKVKQENALLTQKIHMLEENIREVEIRSEERLETERKRNREAIQRLDREKQLEIENYSIRLHTLEKEHGQLEHEALQLRSQAERLKQEKADLEEQLSESRLALTEAESRVVKLEEISRREAERADQERHSSAQLIQELSKEVEELREKVSSGVSGAFNGRSLSADIVDSSEAAAGKAVVTATDVEIRQRVSELDSEVRKLREENRKLAESNEEMQAASLLNRGLEQGKTLLSNYDAAPSSSMSIADELGGMSDFQDMSFGSMSDELDQVKRALKEQQEVNGQLRAYIDGILMNIMEKYPELLEVRK